MALTTLMLAALIGAIIYLFIPKDRPDPDRDERNHARRAAFEAQHRTMRSVWQRAGHTYNGDEYSNAGKTFVWIMGAACALAGLAGGGLLFIILVGAWFMIVRERMNWR